MSFSSTPSSPNTALADKNDNDSRAKHLEVVFADDGIIAKQVSRYKKRDTQVELSLAVAQAIDHQTALIAEAGTGTGKTFAYLVPALLWGGKVIISTGTKHLQDQLFARDLPAVRTALGVPVSIALLKGRANYVCHYHLERTQANGRFTARADASYLRTITRFVKSTKSGDKAEVQSVPENASIWHLVTSTRENCLGAECPSYKDCFVMKARKEAQEADVVVVNHHLFFADLMLRDTGMTELLPTANTLIFDEAHQLPDVATHFFGTTVSTSQLIELARDTLAEGFTHARDALDWREVCAQLEKSARDLRLAFGEMPIKLAHEQLASDAPLFEKLASTVQNIENFANALEPIAERAETIERCWARARELSDLLSQWGKTKSPNNDDAMVSWVETFAQTLQLHTSPLSVANLFSKQREGTPRAWIFTSATLSVRNNFDHFAARLGLLDATAKSFLSPFDFEQQALFYASSDMPPPNTPQYMDAVIEKTLQAVIASRGRAFLLCTTLRAVEQCALRLRDKLEQHGVNYPVLMQGEKSRTELLDHFRELGNAILVGSASFWEGVDVRGEALSLVIIDKLPFAPPDDPVTAARLAVLEREGKNPFMEYSIPQAAIALKQGAGRLIRDVDDRGVLMILDPRLISKPYGRILWQSLPPFKRTRDMQEVVKFFEKAS